MGESGHTARSSSPRTQSGFIPVRFFESRVNLTHAQACGLLDRQFAPDSATKEFIHRCVHRVAHHRTTRDGATDRLVSNDHTYQPCGYPSLDGHGTHSHRTSPTDPPSLHPLWRRGTFRAGTDGQPVCPAAPFVCVRWMPSRGLVVSTTAEQCTPSSCGWESRSSSRVVPP